ncbi:uncharacterized protein LOC111699974 isoform X2 [Eurytemora carolleeae]|uniref:uncharacterized protein LOC111699974 isoform X2 n=1 Tax=Eurytemora carolleeae TaxID=1294199 RepID=UPI000C793530|nr:uncharacterized protein LOC111699974 isoform X2 [Eurytemora carolleeae]|eukprot:XP_023326555.1 uncharacterized protein LOC111699974 isoform X2 [Eurytemora affinis]
MDLLRGFARKAAEDLAEQYGGEKGKDFVEGAFSQTSATGNQSELTSFLVNSFTGKQQMSLEGIMGMVQGSGGEQLRSHAEQKGLDPALLNGVMNLLKGGGGDTGDGASGGGGGFDLSKLMKIVAHLTKGGMNGGGGADGFLDLIGGMGGGDGKTGESSMGNLLQILQGLAKSYFNVKGGSSSAIQSWDAAGAGNNKSDKNFLSWALSVIMDLIFPGKKPKELIEDRQDDDIDTGKKKKDDDVKGWFDGHPEIGKMQKDIFDDIFDTTDDDNNDDDDPAPLIPTPTDFQDNCSCLDNASILFINTNLLLEYRKNWRFLYSSNTHDQSIDELMSKICYKGPTILVVQDGSGRKFGAHASSSWCDTEGGWVGNGESFLFSLEPKMAVFHSTGKDENYQLLTQELLAMGGSKGLYGLEMNNDLSGGTSSGDIETFHTIQLSEDPSFSIQHIEVWGLGPEPNPEQEKQNSRPRQPNLHTRGGNVDMLDLESQIM